MAGEGADWELVGLLRERLVRKGRCFVLGCEAAA
jgi:hypothetical protein